MNSKKNEPQGKIKWTSECTSQSKISILPEGDNTIASKIIGEVDNREKEANFTHRPDKKTNFL
jgi:hypothetical protein